MTWVWNSWQAISYISMNKLLREVRRGCWQTHFSYGRYFNLLHVQKRSSWTVTVLINCKRSFGTRFKTVSSFPSRMNGLLKKNFWGWSHFYRKKYLHTGWLYRKDWMFTYSEQKFHLNFCIPFSELQTESLTMNERCYLKIYGMCANERTNSKHAVKLDEPFGI